MAIQDILLDENGDLLIENGDFVVGPSDNQHIALIINTWLGDWKQFPLCGLGIDDYLASPSTPEVLKRDLTVQLIKDGYKINDIEISNDTDGTLRITPLVSR